jgi:hypothetical protein
MITRQIRIRLPDDEMAELQSLADSFGVNTTTLAALFVKAAKDSVKDNRARLTLPLKFSVEHSEAEQPIKKRR